LLPTRKLHGIFTKIKNITLATGSESALIPGISLDEKDILASKGALELVSSFWKTELKFHIQL